MQTRGTTSDDTSMACLKQLAESSGELHRKVSEFTSSVASVDWSDTPSYRQLMSLRKRLDMVEEISEMIRELTTQGHLFRRMEARALYAEGMTMAQLASVFGVSRQRVSALLRGPVHGTATTKGDDALAVR